MVEGENFSPFVTFQAVGDDVEKAEVETKFGIASLPNMSGKFISELIESTPENLNIGIKVLKLSILIIQYRINMLS